MDTKSTPKKSTNPATISTKFFPSKPKTDLGLSTPYSSSYDSAQTALITTSPYIYDDSDSDDDLIELSFNPNTSLSLTNIDIDSIPPINRITPPPPLFINNSIISSDEYDTDSNSDSDIDSDNQFKHLSIDVPSLTFDNNSQNETCNISKISNTKNMNKFVFNGNDKEPTEKRFNWNVPNKDKMYMLNDYLNKHINSLIDHNLSE